jgi:hypothetical protein
MEFMGRIFGLTATLIGFAMFIITVFILRDAGLLDEAGRAIIGLVLLPIRIADLLIDIGRAFVTGGGSEATSATTTTVGGR